MKNLTIIQDLLIRIAGYDVETAKSCTTSEINKMAKHGTLVIIPAIIGLFSMSYALNLISNKLSISILGGIIWGIIIFLIDRSIVSLNRPGKFNASLLVRLFLAVLIGLVVAEPVVLLAFKDSVKENINKSFLAEKSEIKNKYKNDFLKLDNAIKHANNRLEKMQEEYTNEMDGTGGSGKPNKGPIFKQKFADYNNELIKNNTIKGRINKQREQLNKIVNDEIELIKSSQANGLLGQFRALHSIEDVEVKWATWALRLFFFFIELIPFMIKITPNKFNLYWDIVEKNNEVQLEIINSNNTFKKELMEKQEKLLNKERILKLNEADTQKIAISNEKNTFYLMKELTNATDKKLRQDFKIIKSITDKNLRERLLSEIDIVFSGYIKSMEALVQKSENFYFNNI